jgi:hypothetical protein
MRYLKGREHQEVEQRMAKPPDTVRRQVAVEQWQDISVLSRPNLSYKAANETLNKEFGCPTIVGNDGTVYLKGHISNVPEVSRGIENIDDLRQFGRGFISGVQQVARGTVDLLSRKDLARDTVVGAKDQIGQAVDYFKHSSPDQIGRDVQQLLRSSSQVLEDTLGYPLTQEQRGKYAGQQAMSAFFPIGRKKPLAEEELKILGGAKTLEKMTEAQLGAVGVRRVADYGLRRLSQEELGLRGQFELFEATRQMNDGVQKVSIGLIKARESGSINLPALMSSLKSNALKEGATKLKIETQFKNPELEALWAKRYNSVPDNQGRYSIVIDLTKEH